MAAFLMFLVKDYIDYAGFKKTPNGTLQKAKEEWKKSYFSKQLKYFA
jgi:hypothetical protein